jgi:spermidine synthase
MAYATYVAVALNAAVAVAAMIIAGFARYQASETNATSRDDDRAWTPPAGANVYLVIALSGMTGLGAEVVWTRLLALMLGQTIYTFSIILAVFLFGLGIGSSIGSYLSRYSQRPRIALGICQLLLAGAMGWTAFAISDSMPYWPIDPTLNASPWFMFQLDLVRCLWAILPAAMLWGASFPLALASVSARGQDPG